jgi:two-component system, OmpR family, response regulator
MTLTAPASSARKRILYIEDHEDSREMLVSLLGFSGYEAATATTVADGLCLAMVEQFDLYILDSRFGDGTGVDLCRKLRALHPDIPIIFYSSSAYDHDIEAGLAAGAQHYLIKPNGVYMIEQTIAGLLVGATEARGVTELALEGFDDLSDRLPTVS